MSDYDYGTGRVVGSDIFDTHTTGASFYNDLLPGSGEQEYMASAKNLKGEIKMVSPYEYFQGCADIFNSRRGEERNSAESQIDFIKNYEQDKIDDLTKVITEKKRKFPITYLNYAEKGQEGRHRMYVAGELFGWNKKFPCLIVTHADEDRHLRWVEQKRQYEIEEKIDDAIYNTKRYRFADTEEAAEELEYCLERVKDDLEKYSDQIIVYEIESDPNGVYATIKDDHNVEYKKTINIDELRIEPREEEEDDLSDLDIDDKDLDALLKEIGL